MHEEYMAHDPFIDVDVCVKLFRQLPKGSDNLQYINSRLLTKATQENLNTLSNMYNISWCDYLRYDLKHSFGARHGIIIKGRLNKQDKPVEYWRLETKSPAAGQSYVYYGYRKRIRSYILRRGSVPTVNIGFMKEIKHLENWNIFLEGLDGKKSVEKIKEIKKISTGSLLIHSILLDTRKKLAEAICNAENKIDEVINTLNTLIRLENERNI